MGKVHRCQNDGPFELMEKEVDQASLEDEGVEEHEENYDDVEEDCISWAGAQDAST